MLCLLRMRLNMTKTVCGQYRSPVQDPVLPIFHRSYHGAVWDMVWVHFLLPLSATVAPTSGKRDMRSSTSICNHCRKICREIGSADDLESPQVVEGAFVSLQRK